ncbi:hypothetical protein BpHYR1_017710 [Brachionus plicatilis]|uniref:Uncharacterized protein n=1 Tax=Brachionus plicatilis TaxID=10195 RepID=A0A3M7PQS1_BRAPC|nr:hypothetical protein BpHYR1_017710 [Brachionus plicatilis]
MTERNKLRKKFTDFIDKKAIYESEKNLLLSIQLSMFLMLHQLKRLPNVSGSIIKNSYEIIKYRKKILVDKLTGFLMNRFSKAIFFYLNYSVVRGLKKEIIFFLAIKNNKKTITMESFIKYNKSNQTLDCSKQLMAAVLRLTISFKGTKYCFFNN